MLLISVKMFLSFNWVQLWIVFALKRVKKNNNVLFCLKLYVTYTQVVSPTLCIIGGQSDTLYFWWSFGNFVYLVVLLNSL